MAFFGFWRLHLPWEGAMFALRFNAGNAVTHMLRDTRPGLFCLYFHIVCEMCSACHDQGDCRALVGKVGDAWLNGTLVPKPVSELRFEDGEPVSVARMEALVGEE